MSTIIKFTKFNHFGFYPDDSQEEKVPGSRQKPVKAKRHTDKTASPKMTSELSFIAPAKHPLHSSIQNPIGSVTTYILGQ